MADDLYVSREIDEEELIHEVHIRAFAKYRAQIAKKVEPCFKDIMEKLESLDINDKDMIKYTEELRSEKDGVSEMLNLLISKDGWWDDLVRTLDKMSLVDLSSGLHEVLEMEKKADVEYKERYDEYIATSNDTFVKCKAGNAGINRTEVKVRRLIPRKYQIELAEKAFEGDNCLICAPTGSGKTFVSIMITERHLAKYKEPLVDGAAEKCAGKGSVLFLVPRFALLQQIYRQYKELLPMHSVGKRSGSSPSRVKLVNLIKCNDIIVMTVAILKNALDDGSVKFTDFSLLVFDECHHANKEHNTNKIMEMYIREKYGASPHILPQVVGLTASPGAGPSVYPAAAREWILKLCANLDSSHFVTVKEYEKELNQLASVPKRTTITGHERAPNPFTDSIYRYMDMLEKAIDIPIVPARGSQMYDSCIRDRKHHCMVRTENERVIYCEHLIILNEAIQLASLVRLKDAYALLEEYYTKAFLSRIDGLLDVERNMIAAFTDLLKILKTHAELENVYPNPKLAEVKRIILACKEDCDKDDFKEFRG